MASKYTVSTNRSSREPLTRGKVWVKPTDQMDLWLDSQGYYRKHTAKDASCLYRAVSEQMFLAQAFHLDVRRQCADYAQRHPELLSNISHCSLNDYVVQMRHPHEAAGKLEIEIMSRMYRKDFLIFQDVGKTYHSATNNGFKDQLMLCLSQDRHYDSVYSKQFIANAAFCQSLVYEMLYKGVFQLLEVDYAVKKMLHDKSSKYQRDPSSFLMNGLALRLEIRDTYVNVKDLLNVGVTPFPYKVAKSLDPDIYRNVEYDTWNDIRRGMRFGMFLWNNRELQVGVKCLVKLDSDLTYHAHIQEMTPNKGPVLVFVEELGEKISVPYERLDLLPQSPQPQSPLPFPLKQLKQLQTMKALTSNSEDTSDTCKKDQLLEFYSDQGSDNDSSWPNDMEVDGRCTPKLKMLTELPKVGKRPNKSFHGKTKELQQVNNEPTKNQIEVNSVVSSSDCNYQQQEELSYQHEHFEEYNSQNYINQEPNNQPLPEGQIIHKGPEVRPCAPTMIPCVEPQPYWLPSAEGYTHPTFCYVPHKSVLPDGSDLPLADMATLRFYYNYGVDYSRGIRPSPPCYLNTSVAYLPDPNVSPVVYDHASPISTPDSAIVMSPVGVYAAQRPDSLPVLPQSPGGVSVVSEPDSTTFNFNTQNVAPRFKNKIRTSQGKHYEAPVIQQAEVSSTTNIPMPTTHYIPPPIFYHPVECEAYCPANYVEYSVYDPAAFYPGAHPPVPPIPTHPPTHYIHPDASFYQHVVAAPLASTV